MTVRLILTAQKIITRSPERLLTDPQITGRHLTGCIDRYDKLAAQFSGSTKFKHSKCNHNRVSATSATSFRPVSSRPMKLHPGISRHNDSLRLRAISSIAHLSIAP